MVARSLWTQGATVLLIGSGSGAIATLNLPFFTAPAFAQLLPDNSLGAESSEVTPDVTVRDLPADLVEGGAIRGSNLFHSFQEFNVGTGQRVYFANPIAIENILTRITGGNDSNIDGLLGVDGAANLFLLNPNGVIFGPSARLDISGSFLTSTGSSFTFADGSEFSAVSTGDELLSVSVPLGVQFNDRPQGDINQIGDLAIGAGETLTLFGSTVLNSGRLASAGGTVQVLGDRIGLLEQAQVNVAGDSGGGSVLIGGGYQGSENVPNASRTYVGPDVLIRADALEAGEGGRVIVWADEQTGFWGQVSAQGGPQAGNGGFVEISGKADLTFNGAVNTTALNGQAGTLLLDPANIIIANFVPSGYTNVDSFNPVFSDFLYAALENGTSNSHIFPSTIRDLLSQNDLTLEATDRIQILNDVIANSNNDLTLRASTVEVNNAVVSAGGGDLNLESPLDAKGSVLLSGSGLGILLQRAPGVITSGGNISVTGYNIELDGSLVGTTAIFSPNATLNSGDVQITGNTIAFNGSLVGNSSIFSSGTTLDSGEITITANESMTFNGSAVGVSSNAPGFNNTGNINLNGGVVSLTGQTFIGTQVGVGATNSGSSINVDSDSLSLDNQSILGTTILPDATADSGDINIASDTVRLSANSEISSRNLGQGNSGRVRIDAEESLILENNAFVLSVIGNERTNTATGNSAGVLIDTQDLFVLDGSRILASTFAVGNSGPVEINASGNVSLTGTNGSNPTGIFSQVFSAATGDSGGIVLNSQNLRVADGAVIGADTLGRGNSGRIEITTTGTVAVEGNNSVIQNEVFEGAIGNSQGIQINTSNLDVLDGARVTASTLGRGNSGRVQIDADQNITVSGTNSRITSQVERTAIGQSGGIAVSGNNLSVLDGANISASTFGLGDSGVLQLEIAETVLLQGNGSSLASQVGRGALGDSAGIMLSAANLSVIEGASIEASVDGQGNSGAIQIDVDDNLLVSGADTAIASQVNPGAIGNSGGVRVNARLLTVANRAFIAASTFGQGNSGTVDLNIAESTTLSGGNIISQVNPGAIGDSAGINLSTGNLSLFEEAAITADTIGQGNSGLVKIETVGDLLIDGSQIASRVINRGIDDRGQGNSSGISIAARNLSAVNNASISSGTEGQGDAGAILIRTTGDIFLNADSDISSDVFPTGEGDSQGITIQTNHLALADRSEITSTTFGRGNAGALEINATGNIRLADRAVLSTQVNPGAVGNSDRLTLSANHLTVTEASFISSLTAGTGNAAPIEIEALGGVLVDGDTSFIGSLVSTNAQGEGSSISILTDELAVTNRAQISADSRGNGTPGSIRVQSGQNSDLTIRLTGDGAIRAATESPFDGGDIEIATGGLLTLQGVGRLTTESVNPEGGRAGNITIQSRVFKLSEGVEVAANSASRNGGGNIAITTDSNIFMRGSSFINANSTNEEAGDGGNIAIRIGDGFLFGVGQDNDIIASAIGGNGGNINISALRIFGFSQTDESNIAILRDNGINDISASSEFGFDGQIALNTLDLDPSQGLVELPLDLEDRTNQIATGCGLGSTDDGSEFVVTGRGGLPPNSNDPIVHNSVDVPWVMPDNSAAIAHVYEPHFPTEAGSLVEAQSIVLDAEGNAYFAAETANGEGATPTRLNPQLCNPPSHP